MYEDYILYYNRDRDRFYDEGGYEVSNIFRVISPNTFWLFRESGEDMLAYALNGELIGLVWEECGEEN
jgi:hypothetical protein